MKRYVISPVVGAGTAPNPYRAAVADVLGQNEGVTSPIRTNAQGVPLYHFALCIVSTTHLPSVAAVSNLYVLPDYSLDGRMDGMEADARSALTQNVPAYNMDGAGLHFSVTHQDDDSYRQVLAGLLAQFDPAYPFDSLDVRGE